MHEFSGIARVALGSLLLVMLPAALAQAPDGPGISAAEPEPLPRYRVELIFFAHNSGETTGEDLFHGIEDPDAPPAPGLLRVPGIELDTLFGFDPFAPAPADDADAGSGATPDAAPAAAASENPAAAAGAAQGLPALPADGLELIEPAAAAGRNRRLADTAAALPPAFRPLHTDELELGDIDNMLRRVPRYRVIAHAGFEQAGVEETQAIPVDLGRLGLTNPEGSVTLWLGRYLHVGVDLNFYEAGGTRWTALPGPGLAPLEYARAYRLVAELNAIRSSDEPRYIDHPLYGVIVIVRPAPEPEEVTETETGNGPAA